MNDSLSKAAIQVAETFWRETVESCSDCDVCTFNCELLNEHEMTLAELAAIGLEVLEYEAAGHGSLKDAVRRCIKEHPSLYNLVFSCFLCGKCSAHCPHQNRAENVIVALRQVFILAEVLDASGSKMTMVDNEWHLFSVYRAVHGIWYNDLLSLDRAAPGDAEYLFFPGCALSSYAPELTREIFSWIDENVGKTAFTDLCCGSPMKSIGLGERARVHKNMILTKMAKAGISKMITVCPGCGSEYFFTMKDFKEFEIELIPLPRLMLKSGFKGKAALDKDKGKGKGSSATYSIFDSCRDRNFNHGTPVRELLKDYNLKEMESFGKDTLCCSAGGGVCAFNQGICTEREVQIYDEMKDAGANALITVCPTCAYTFSYPHARLNTDKNILPPAIENINYLELLFENEFDWHKVFENLVSMWTGEYGEWASEQLL